MLKNRKFDDGEVLKLSPFKWVAKHNFTTYNGSGGSQTRWGFWFRLTAQWWLADQRNFRDKEWLDEWYAHLSE